MHKAKHYPKSGSPRADEPFGKLRLSTSFHKFTHVFFKLQASDVDLVTYNTYKLNHVKT